MSTIKDVLASVPRVLILLHTSLDDSQVFYSEKYFAQGQFQFGEDAWPYLWSELLGIDYLLAIFVWETKSKTDSR